MPLWTIRLQSAPLASEDGVFDEGIDELLSALERIPDARGPVAYANVLERWVSARFVVVAEDFAQALDRAVTIFERAVDDAGIGEIPVAQAEVVRESLQHARTSKLRIGVSTRAR